MRRANAHGYKALRKLPKWIKPVGLGAKRVRTCIFAIISGQPKITDTFAMNELLVFVCDGAPVRGEIISLTSTWRAIQERRHDHPVINRILGEFVAAAALLMASIKLDGTLIIQAQSKGPIRLLVIECNSQLTIRATVKMADNLPNIDSNSNLATLLDAEHSGRLVITLDPVNRQASQPPYQGIVALQHEIKGQLQPIQTVAEAIMLYMQNSEQLETRIWLASSEKAVGGLLLQKMPDHGGTQTLALDPDLAIEGWNRIQTLGATITADELLSLSPETILRRLFLEESHHYGVRSFPPRLVLFSCRCSRERVADVLRMMGQEEVDSILEEQGSVTTHCDFCGAEYRFDPVDCKQVFISQTLSDAVRPPSKGH
jgi:molecular chaperone Hsp33